jgi:hypothetical protein
VPVVKFHPSDNRLQVAHATDSAHPTSTWMQEQGEAFNTHAGEQKLKAKIVLSDRARVLGSGFKEAVESAGVRVQRVCVRSRNMNAYVERFIQTIQQECLDKFIVFGWST